MTRPACVMFFSDGCFFPFNQLFTSMALAFITSKSVPETSILAHFRGHDLPAGLIAPETCMTCSSHVLRNVIGDGVLVIAVMWASMGNQNRERFDLLAHCWSTARAISGRSNS